MIFPCAIGVALWYGQSLQLEEVWIVAIEAVDKIELIPVLAEDTTDREQTNRFHPQIKGGEIVDPRVDEQQTMF